MTVHPSTRWWIKGDGTDVVKGLWESVSGKWAGDVDVDDGKVDQLYKEVQDRVTWVKTIGTAEVSVEEIKKNLLKALKDNSADLEFVTSGMFMHLL